ncbi:SAC3 domain-containing protein 1 isoform X2 [Brienomyrus brachyistius]|uniref:SAC3 domain-containing protein 1 isoform X2 n=1 Tax=Brienomyrus brachyistius TaxID=42636 RepID=UPI0020B3D31A|nr:SAC3 domain-containing protein 1 isoform X2 [Brienomyrus brachyistius]
MSREPENSFPVPRGPHPQSKGRGCSRKKDSRMEAQKNEQRDGPTEPRGTSTLVCPERERREREEQKNEQRDGPTEPRGTSTLVCPERERREREEQKNEQRDGPTEPRGTSTLVCPERERREREEQKNEQRDGPTEPRGTCTLMCPERERREREAQKRLHRFEMVPGTENDRLPRADPTRTVKEYSRPAAGKEATRPCDLRPPPVLFKTVCYLINAIALSPSLQPWTEVYDFVFDRLRSVRQDMIIQRVSGPECAAVLERIVRFLLYASYRLCEEPLRLYDPRINDTHLQESLSWLLSCYSVGQHPHQEEIQALSLLYNLGSTRALQHALELPEEVRAAPAVRLALSVNYAHMESNPVRLLRLARRLDFLQSCALHRHLEACRRHLLLLYSHGHSSRNCRLPLRELARLLALEESQAARLCQTCGVSVKGDFVSFSKASYVEPPLGEMRSTRSYELVDRKQGDRSLAVILHGSP